MTFETDRTTSTSIDTDNSLKSDVTCENADHLICESLPQNTVGKTGNNCVSNSGRLGSLVIRATRQKIFPEGYFGLTIDPLTNYAAPGLNALRLQTSMRPPIVVRPRPYLSVWARQLVSIVPNVNQVHTPLVQFWNNPSAEQVESLTVTIKYKTGITETVKFNETRKYIGFSLLKGSDDDVAKTIMKDTAIKRSCTNSLLTELKDQCIGLCHLNNPSMLQSKKVQDIISFKLGALLREN